MPSPEYTVHSKHDFGWGYTALIYANQDKSQWKHRVFNPNTGESVESDFNLLTYEACYTHAIEVVISSFSRIHNYTATLKYMNNSDLQVTITNSLTNGVELLMSRRTSYQMYKDKLLVLKVLQALVEQA
jgi:hypothetical protein